jgi:hypothetical protein
VAEVSRHLVACE